MAGRPKKTETTEKATTSKKTTTTTVDNDIQEQLKLLQEQLAKLQAENEALKAEPISANTDEEEITSDTDITVVSQVVGTLTISTEGNGIGTVYNFEHFGEAQDIPFGDLRDIVKNKPNFAKEGVYYICNPQAVKKLRLDHQYENLIDKNTFANILDMDSKTVVALYQSAPKLQQEQIVGLIEEKIEKKQDVDGNILIQIGRLCGKDFLAMINDDNE
jgi:hypothetical protein